MISKVFPFPRLTAIQFKTIVDLGAATFPALKSINYDLFYLDGKRKYIRACPDFERIKRALQKDSSDVKKIVAKLTEVGINACRWNSPHLEITIRPVPSSMHPWAGFQIIGTGLSKKAMFQLVSKLAEQYPIPTPELKVYGLGRPREILVAFVDMREFSQFCEQARIESPYISCLVSTLLGAASAAFDNYEPELIKALGDGIVAVWEICEDRELALAQCLVGLAQLEDDYQFLKAHPQFQHGLPKGIAVGIAAGFASLLASGNDYVGRPLNIASRLCSQCDAGFALIEVGTPGWNKNRKSEKVTLNLKTFGNTDAWKTPLTG